MNKVNSEMVKPEAKWFTKAKCFRQQWSGLTMTEVIISGGDSSTNYAEMVP